MHIEPCQNMEELDDSLITGEANVSRVVNLAHDTLDK